MKYLSDLQSTEEESHRSMCRAAIVLYLRTKNYFKIKKKKRVVIIAVIPNWQ
jgi:hypothetical protein